MTYTPKTNEDLRIWRAAHNLGKGEAAAVLGVTRQTLHYWEQGRYPRDLAERMLRAEGKIGVARGQKRALSLRQRRDRFMQQTVAPWAKTKRKLLDEYPGEPIDLEGLQIAAKYDLGLIVTDAVYAGDTLALTIDWDTSEPKWPKAETTPP